MSNLTGFAGMIGRKSGMMTLYDGSGRARGVTVIELSGNRVTQIRDLDRDGYEAVQIGAPGRRKNLSKPERGHLRAADLEREPLGELQEFHVTDTSEFELGQIIKADQFTPGTYVNVTGTSKGRGFAGVVRRWNFRGGPKTHGQSDRHRAPGSIGAGTTPGRVWKGQKMGGHMGARRRTGLNQLVVYVDSARDLLFVEGAVAGPRNGFVTVTSGQKSPLTDYEPPDLDLSEIPQNDLEEAVSDMLSQEASDDVSIDVTGDENPNETDDAPPESEIRNEADV